MPDMKHMIVFTFNKKNHLFDCINDEVEMKYKGNYKYKNKKVMKIVLIL